MKTIALIIALSSTFLSFYFALKKLECKYKKRLMCPKLHKFYKNMPQAEFLFLTITFWIFFILL